MAGRSLAACALALAACGRIGFDSVGAGDAAGGDAAVAPPFTLSLDGLPSGLRSIAAFPDGRVAVVGYIGSPTTFGGSMVNAFGGTDILIAVINFDGSVAWARSFGSSGDDEAWGVSIGADGSIYVTGEIEGPVNFGGGMLVPQGYNPFVASFTADGAYRWAVRFGNTVGTGLVESGFRMVTAANGDVLVVGRVEGTVDFGDGQQTTSSSSSQDGFVVRLRGSDGHLAWKQRWNTSGGSIAFGVAEDATGNVYAVGAYTGTANFGAGNVANRGADDAVVLALTSGGAYRWARTFGGTGSDWAFGAAVVGQAVVAVGYYGSTIDLPVPASKGLQDSFIATYALDGTPGWARGFGGTGCDLMNSVHGAGGEIVVSGAYSGTLDLGDGPHTAVDLADVLVASFTPAGQATWSTAFGGAGDDAALVTIGARTTGLYLVAQLGIDLAADCTNYPSGGRGLLRHL